MPKNGFGHGKKRKKRQADRPKDSVVKIDDIELENSSKDNLKLEPLKFPQFYPAQMRVPKPLKRGNPRYKNDKNLTPFDGKIDMFMDLDMDSGEKLIKNKTKLEANGLRLRSASSKKDDFVFECEKTNNWYVFTFILYCRLWLSSGGYKIRKILA